MRQRYPSSFYVWMCSIILVVFATMLIGADMKRDVMLQERDEVMDIVWKMQLRIQDLRVRMIKGERHMHLEQQRAVGLTHVADPPIWEDGE